MNVRWQTAAGALAALALAASLGGLPACESGHQGNAVNVADALQALTAAEVDAIIAQAVLQAQALGVEVAVSVTDREGEVLGSFRMTGAMNFNVRAATSKAATASAFQSEQNAFTSRTAYFIVQGNFPPGVRDAPGGPLFGVQDSSQACSDVHAAAYDDSGDAQSFGITGLFGGVPLYKNGAPVGGVGVEGAEFALDGGAMTLQTPLLNGLDEALAVAASRGFGTPSPIRATNAFIDGIRLPFLEESGPAPIVPGAAMDTAAELELAGLGTVVGAVRTSPLMPEDRVAGQYGVRADRRLIPRLRGRLGDAALTPVPFDFIDIANAGETPPTFDGATYRFLDVPIVPMSSTVLSGVPGAFRYTPIDSREPPTASGGLTAAEVRAIMERGVDRARRASAGIRLPRGSGVRVHIAVCDLRGNILGVFRMGDGTLFSFDVAVQKARTSAYFSSDGNDLDHRGLPLLDAAGMPLPSLAVSCRGVGFLAQPFFPPGISGGRVGPLARLRDLVNRGKLPLEARPSLTVVDLLPRPPNNGIGTFDDDFQEPGFQIFDDYVGFPSPLLADLTQVRAAITETFGYCALADRDSVNRSDSLGIDFVSPGLQNGLQTFPGGVPLYRNGRLIGAIGVSGDGVDEDDLVAFAGAVGFEPPGGTRIDTANEGVIRVVLTAKADALADAVEAHPDPVIRTVYGPLFRTESDAIAASLARGLEGVRIPYVKFPRNPGER